VIREIDFDNIYFIWKNFLWEHRTSPIEKVSAMLFCEGYDLRNFDYEPTFFAYYVNDNIAGVNSGHMCCDNTYRSRGLFVFPEYRKRGIGKELLLATIDKGFKKQANFVWSYPKKESWNTYNSVGFTLSSKWERSEMGINAYCKIGAGAP
jgi:GNAT superfamily N-acetyltransferase